MRQSSISTVVIVSCLSVVLSGCACKETRDPAPGTRASPTATSATPSPSSGPAHVPLGAQPEAQSDWCAEHGVPEPKCTRCNPSLIADFKAKGDWCEEHNFPESICPSCNPQAPPVAPVAPVAAVAPVAPVAPLAPLAPGAAPADWCLEHALPESRCTRCNPSLVAEFKAKGDWCKEHDFPESVCPVCNRAKPPAGAERAAIEARSVRLRSPHLERAAGIQTTAAELASASQGVDCTARIEFDANRMADIRALIPGIVRRARAELGAQVARGAPLFDLESTRVAETQGALQAARARVQAAKAHLARQRALVAGEVASPRDVELAEHDLASSEAEARTAEATLRMAGAPEESPSGRYTLSAPIAGVVVRRPAVVGLLATESESLATLADTSVMWALCDVPEAQAARVALGQKVAVRVEGSDEAPLEGVLTWLAAEVDPRTRTVAARASVANEGARLRANQFARARIETDAAERALMVPRSAVQRVGGQELVFVRTGEGVYEPRVVLRHGEGERVRVEGRLQAGDLVVTTGAVLLKTELLPGSIGAGCCEVGPGGAD